MSHAHATRQTPDAVLAELDRLGEDAVREKLELGHFAPYKIALIEGWLHQKDAARERAIQEKLEAEKCREERRANRVLIDAEQGRGAAESARMFAIAATVLASVALVLSILALVGLGR